MARFRKREIDSRNSRADTARQTRKLLLKYNSLTRRWSAPRIVLWSFCCLVKAKLMYVCARGRCKYFAGKNSYDKHANRCVLVDILNIALWLFVRLRYIYIYMHWRIIVLQFPTSIFVSAAQSKICAKEDTVQPFTIDDFVALHRWCLFTLRICFVRSCKIWNKCDEHVIAIWVYIRIRTLSRVFPFAYERERLEYFVQRDYVESRGISLLFFMHYPIFWEGKLKIQFYITRIY